MDTCRAKFGTDFAAQNAGIKEKIKNNILEKYGVEYNCLTPNAVAHRNSTEAVYKQHLTKVRNGTYNKSHLEIELFEAINSLLPAISQIWLKGKFSIDIYVPNCKCMVQLDGIHWHCLDKDPNFEPKSIHETNIKKKFGRDRILDKYIIDNSMRLIHITDEFYKINRKLATDIVLNLLQSDWTGVKYLGEHYKKFGLNT